MKGDLEPHGGEGHDDHDDGGHQHPDVVHHGLSEQDIISKFELTKPNDYLPLLCLFEVIFNFSLAPTSPTIKVCFILLLLNSIS